MSVLRFFFLIIIKTNMKKIFLNFIFLFFSVTEQSGAVVRLVNNVIIKLIFIIWILKNNFEKHLSNIKINFNFLNYFLILQN